MPSSFSRLKQLKVTSERTSIFELPYDLGSLELRHAGEGNAAWWRATLRRTNEARGGSDKVSEASIAEARDVDIAMFAEHVIVGWRGITEDTADGSQRPATFNVPNVVAFLRELVADAPDVWNALRRHATDVDNFRDARQLSGADLGKQ